MFTLLCEGGYAVLPGSAFGMPVERGCSWFRVTLVHLPIGELIQHLKAVERLLLAHRATSPGGRDVSEPPDCR